METFKDAISSEGLVLEQLKATLGDRIRILKVDADKHQDTTAAYGIQSVPTLILFHNGELQYRHSEAIQKVELCHYSILS